MDQIRPLFTVIDVVLEISFTTCFRNLISDLGLGLQLNYFNRFGQELIQFLLVYFK